LAEAAFWGCRAAQQRLGALKVVRWLREVLAALGARRSLSVLCQDDSVLRGPGTAHGGEGTMGLQMIGTPSSF